MNDGRRLQRQDRQAAVDGLSKGAVRRDGKEGDVAEGEIKRKPKPSSPARRNYDFETHR